MHHPLRFPMALRLSLLVPWVVLAACEPAPAPEVAEPSTQVAPEHTPEVADHSTQVSAEHMAAVEALADNPGVRSANEYLEAIEERSLQDLIRLTEVPAPPFVEEERARAFAQMLREAGADSVWIDGIGNVIGLRRGTVRDRTVALDGHLDTVFPPETDVTVRFRGDTLYAPGVADDTRGLIVVRNVLEALVAQDLRTPADLLFIGTVGEEGLGDLRGVKHLFGEEGPGIDSFIAVDGSGDAGIIHSGTGSNRYRVTFRGPGGHSWGAFGLGNPAHALAQAVAGFVPEADRRTASGPRTSYNVGRIGGGTSVNSIPFEAWMEVDLRSVDPASLATLDGVFREAMQRGLEEQNSLRRSGEPLTVELDQVGLRPAGSIDPGEPLVQRALAATRLLGREPTLGGASTNANTPLALGVPAITIGNGGRAGGAHSLDEWWLPVEPHVAAQRALLILLAEAGGIGVP
jgi:tripeptide aminopeptidase